MKKNKSKRYKEHILSSSNDNHQLRKDIYFFFLQMSWPSLIALLFLLYTVLNTIFAYIYTLIPYGINNIETISFTEAFFFSVQTVSTIGYGIYAPTGTLANIVVCIQAIISIITIAFYTGIVFSRISRPNAKVRFSKNIIINTFNGERCLCFRMGNIRGNDIVAAKINLSIILDIVTEEGEEMRSIHDLKLRRSYTPFFRLSWSIFHVIDEDSPFYNYSNENNKIRAIIASLTGHDDTYSNTIYTRYRYSTEDILVGSYFKDIVSDLPNGDISVNYNDFDELK